ncbi:hypothetical protein BZA05DRAFT_380936 [Tricharina praecox]|uniref:uncharacterized protein n=1 Tax=Tricharina praecox TaxID=43433 RepID=UPI00221FB1FF|nr:uncharacterized protein BZA05DRAFT_380936 [Tricharina praecox]KAI5858353.1 hypothetical protein BZA05DRAFT_380936 [Tricharina praecox]
MRPPHSIPTTVPSLQSFLLRTRALHFYRDILRATAQARGRHELRQWAKDEFLRNRNVTDQTHIRYLLDMGKREFTTMKRYLEEEGR